VPPTDGGGPPGPELTGVTDLGVGYAHACAVREGGQLVCWGSNTCGEIGVVISQDRVLRPIVVMASGVSAVASGSDFSCAIVGGSGGVQCWGSNTWGQLGDGTSDDRATPAPVMDLSGATAIALGDDSACAVVAGGSVKCWGSNTSGELGNPSAFSDSYVPIDVMGGLTGVTRLSADWNHACAVDGTPSVRCWGTDVFGQLGTDDGDHDTAAAAVSLSGTPTDVTTGVDHTCAIHGGAVSCWGSNESSQLGRTGSAEQHLPVAVDGIPEPATRLIEGQGFSHTCVVVESGRLYCWGAADALGAGALDLPNGRPTPAEPMGLSDVVEVSAGAFATCARTSAGTVRCWGYNAWGPLGDGTQTDRFVPAPVLAPE
jgi:alpha-tubulin suppressor-like RCC1 family protein